MIQIKQDEGGAATSIKVDGIELSRYVCVRVFPYAEGRRDPGIAADNPCPGYGGGTAVRSGGRGEGAPVTELIFP